MATQKEMCTVRVYVENNSSNKDDDEEKKNAKNHNAGNATVTKEDIVDWLSLLDKLEEVKLQYDAGVQQMCYLVCFAHSTAAQQAVQYLSGAKLKNYKITITSTVYKQQDVSNNKDEEEGQLQNKTGSINAMNEIESSVEGKDEWQVETLPFNHLIPLDIRMDTALAEYLPEICKGGDNNTNNNIDNGAFTGAPELYNLLCTLQEQIHNSLMELETLRNSVYHLNDINVVTSDINSHNDNNESNLHDANKTSNINKNTHKLESITENANVQPSQKTNVTTFGNTKGIMYTTHPPVKVIGFLTRCFGVVSRCTSVLLSTSNNEYLLRVAFMMNEDAHDFALFLSTLRHTNNNNSNNKERNATFFNHFLQGDEMYDEMCELLRNTAWQDLTTDAWNWNAFKSFQLPNTNNISSSGSNSNVMANTAINNPAHQMIASLLHSEVEK